MNCKRCSANAPDDNSTHGLCIHCSALERQQRHRALREALVQEVAAELGIPADEAEIICNW